MIAASTDITFPRPHSPTQWDLVDFPGNVVMFAGRRYGKTEGAVLRLFRRMVDEPGLYWWVGLSWRSASLKRAWRIVTDYARKVLRALGQPERSHINKSSHEVRIPGLGEIWFRTADNPSSLAGEGIRGAVVDEFTLMQEIVWTEYLEATLLDYGGWVCFIGVPKGRNWGASLWHNAADREGWKQLHATSYDNPYIDGGAIDEIKANRGEALFNQEYMALVVDDAGGVFRRVMDAATATEQDEPTKGHQYAFGVDWAQQHDFTVIAVVDVTDKALVYLDRFNRIDYAVQRGRLQALYERFRPSTIYSELNSIGGPVSEQLQRTGLPITPMTTTNATKTAWIDALALAFERGDIRILPDPVLIGELQAFEMSRSKTGLRTFSAPNGMHDDTVMALAMAWQGCVGGFEVW